jgi:hypothetical protein
MRRALERGVTASMRAVGFTGAVTRRYVYVGTSNSLVVDCLPQLAPLSDGSMSALAAAILDTTSNVEFGSAVHGELPGDVVEADTCDDPNDTARLAIERDAIRFSRTIDFSH